MHPVLAFISFWKLLFGATLPAEAAKFLPETAKALPAPPPDERVVVAKVPEKEKPVPKQNSAAQQREGALALLALLQREGRFVDFISEELGTADDADIGAAVRAVHRGCKKVFDQVLSLEPVMPGEEETKVSVPKGFDPAEIRLIGEAKGEAPYKGTLRHHGWRAVATQLPSLAEGVDLSVLAPAEVELSA
ncbi:hypothetical protein BH11MYX1_BH11MYX1_04400 [soil metagenome]